MIPGCLAALLIFGFPSMFMAGYLAALDEDEKERDIPKTESKSDTNNERGDG
jgi:hypothetical protein